MADIQHDLDTPRAIQKLRKLERDELISGATKAACFIEIDKIYGLELARPPEVKAELSPELQELIGKRSQARLAKDFALSDQLRAELNRLGVSVKDTPEGQEWECI